MAIKLKNSRKFAVVLIFAVIFSCACSMVAAYPVFEDAMKSMEADGVDIGVTNDITDNIIRGNYFLYNEVYGEVERSYLMDNYGDVLDSFALLQKYMDYEIFDYSGEAQLGENSDVTLKKLVKEGNTYAFCASFLFEADGSLKEARIVGSQLSEQEQYSLEQRA